jgi:hypothetical protein
MYKGKKVELTSHDKAAHLENLKCNELKFKTNSVSVVQQSDKDISEGPHGGLKHRARLYCLVHFGEQEERSMILDAIYM